MSTKAYSTDIRIRVIKHIESGKSQVSASLLFSISKSAVSRWWIRYKNEKQIAAKPKLGSKGKIDVKALREYVAMNSDKNLAEIGARFKVSNCAIYKRLKALGYSYKKKPIRMWKQTKKKELNIKK